MKRVKITDAEFQEREGYERAVLFSPEDYNSNTKLQLMKLAPGQRIGPHHHELRTESFMIISGHGEIRINGDIATDSKEDLILCEVGDIHEFINLSPAEPFIVLVVRTNDTGNSDMIWENDSKQ